MSEPDIDLEHWRPKPIDLRTELEAAARVGNARADSAEYDPRSGCDGAIDARPLAFDPLAFMGITCPGKAEVTRA